MTKTSEKRFIPYLHRVVNSDLFLRFTPRHIRKRTKENNKVILQTQTTDTKRGSHTRTARYRGRGGKRILKRIGSF